METPFTVAPSKVRAALQKFPCGFSLSLMALSMPGQKYTDGPQPVLPLLPHCWALSVWVCLWLLLSSQDGDTSFPTTTFPSLVPTYKDFPSNSALWGSMRNGVDRTKLRAFPLIEGLRGIFLWICPSLIMQTYQHDSKYLGTHIVSCYRKEVAVHSWGAECEGTDMTAAPPQTTATLQSVLSCLLTGIPHPQQEVHQGEEPCDGEETCLSRMASWHFQQCCLVGMWESPMGEAEFNH